MIGAILPLAVSWAAGWLLVGICCPGLNRFLMLAAAAGLGTAITSLTAFLLLPAGVASAGWTIMADATLLAILGTAFYLQVRRGALAQPVSMVRAPLLGRAAQIVFGACLVSAAVAWARTDYPHGEWDAWALWNLRARFLFRGLAHWRDAFSPLLAQAHPDYPLLLPASVLRGWLYTGQETTLVPRAIAWMFTFSTAAVLASGVTVLRGATQGMAAGALLLATTLFVRQGALQYADVPLAFFVVTTVVFLSIANERPQLRRGCLVVAGIAAGSAAWTKNEGAVFLVIVLAVCAVLYALTDGWRESATNMAAMIAGALPFATAAAYLKLRIAPVSDVFLTQGSAAASAHLTDTSRYAVILKSFWVALPELRLGGLHPLILPLLYLAIAGGNRDRRARSNAISGAAILLLMLCGYAAAYAVTPADLAWQINYSVHRLLLQLWPAFLCVVFLYARAPEQFQGLPGKKPAKRR